ncbi:ice-binding family protein [Dyadobacter sp. CY261]|uniref:ice-binding family protein n=1 Tax=Dyadobacter sp. CY261 TaxID=2907203 RepID=UPI001F239B1D|nr:ice-binding family protein [Dyadobacter sp. CY261]MCF0069376.1 ice-binding family protein [Dyadobacter sp. CY261]
MISTTKKISLFATWLLLPSLCFGQAPDLGTAADFAAFTTVGAFNNDGTSVLVGDIGTNAGAFNGFPPGTVVGETHVADGASAQAATDLGSAYAAVSALTDCSVLATTLGNGQVLTPDVYCLGAASTLNGNLILDGQNDPNAVFIIKIDGALTANALSMVTLINSATFDNVYWQITGRFDLGEGSIFRGTVLGGGAIELLEGSAIVGRALTTAGAISLHNNEIVSLESALPVALISFTVAKGEGQTAILKWTTSEESNSDRFEIEHSFNGKTWVKHASTAASGESTVLTPYFYTEAMVGDGIHFYRLKMIDKDETFSYSRIQSIKATIVSHLSLYPNPATDRITLDADDLSQTERIQLNDNTGKVLHDQQMKFQTGTSTSIDLKQIPTGLYFVRVTDKNGNIVSLKMIKQ